PRAVGLRRAYKPLLARGTTPARYREAGLSRLADRARDQRFVVEHRDGLMRAVRAATRHDHRELVRLRQIGEGDWRHGAKAGAGGLAARVDLGLGPAGLALGSGQGLEYALPLLDD